MPSRLLIAGGTSSGFLSPPVPPAGAVWTKSAGNPILSALAGWEGGQWILEPTVWIYGGFIHMFYTGDNQNTASQQMGYATCPLTSDPTVGASWTRSAGNPVLGGGVVYAGPVTQPDTFILDPYVYVYYSGTSNVLCVARAPLSNPTDFTVLATNILAKPGGITQWNNTSRVIVSGTWKMLVEAYDGAVYETYYAESADGLAWTIGNGGAKLSTLDQTPGWGYGGPFLWQWKIGGLWHLWYHVGGIRHATSPDLITWTPSGGFEVLARSGTGFEIDQIADPSIVILNGIAYLFYDGDQNSPAFTGAIGVATAAAV